MTPGHVPLDAEPHTSGGQELRAHLVQEFFALALIAFMMPCTHKVCSSML